MNSHEHGFLINGNGNVIDFYNLSTLAPKLLESQSVISTDYQIALTMIKPRWTGTKWEETATTEEIETAKMQREQLLDIS